MHADIARVRGEHDVLDRQAGELQAIIVFGPSRCANAFLGLAGYARVLSEHLSGEHDVLEDAQKRAGEAIEAHSQMGCELDALRRDWERYLSVWTEETALADWGLFSEHSLVILDRIRKRIGRENELLDFVR